MAGNSGREVIRGNTATGPRGERIRFRVVSGVSPSKYRVEVDGVCVGWVQRNPLRVPRKRPGAWSCAMIRWGFSNSAGQWMIRRHDAAVALITGAATVRRESVPDFLD